MKLRRVRILHFPGFARTLDLSIEGDLVLIQGPNASGKSSLCRALGAALWPTGERGRMDVLFEREDGGRLEVNLDGGAVQWSSDGRAVERPQLPGAEYRACYFLGIRSLLEDGGGDDRALAAAIRRQMAGGVDLVKLLRSKDLKPNPRVVEKKKQQAEKKKQEWVAVERELQALATKEDGLVELERELEERRREGERLELYKKALRRLVLWKEIREIRDRLAGLPEATAFLRGDELERLAEIEKRVKLERERADAAKEALEDAERRIEENALPHGVLKEGVLPKLKAAASQVVGMEAKLADQEHRLEAKRRAFEKMVLSWGWKEKELEDGCERVLAALEGEEGRLEDLLSAFQENSAEEKAIRAERGRLAKTRGRLLEEGDGCPPWKKAEILRGMGELERVLTWSLMNPGTLVLALGGEALVLTLAPLWAGLLFGGVTVLVLGLERWVRLGRFRKSALGQEFPGEPLEVFHRLQGEWARRESWERLQGDEEALALREERWNEREREIRVQAFALREAMGLDPKLGTMGLVDWGRRLFRLREIEEELEESRESYELSLRKFEGKRSRLVQSLRSLWGEALQEALDEEMSGAECCEQVGLLEERNAALKTALGDRNQAEKRWREAEEGWSGGLSSLQKLYEGLGLQKGDREALEEAARHLQDFRKESKALEQRELELGDLERALADEPELLQAEEDQVQSWIRGAEEANLRVQELIEERGRIRGEIDRTKKSEALGRALDAYEGARADWLKSAEREARKALARGLLRAVLEESAAQVETPVFERAKELFLGFTRGRFQLKLKPADGAGEEDSFFAWDQEREEALPLSRLSDGTRSQLLLAARMAFATVEERGVSLPLFLDEALSHADEVRFKAVLEALLSLVRAGRQIVLLTADEADLSRVKAQVSGTDLADRFQLIRLAEHLGQPREGETPYLLPQPASIPSPSGLSPAEYAARLRVPAPSLHEPAGALHLFYLLDDDLPLLHSLLLQGYTTVAQFTSLETPRGDTHVLRLRCELWLRFRELWGLNRPRPLRREALEGEGSPLRSSKFLPEILRFIPEDGLAFSEFRARLEQVPRLNKKTRERVEAWGKASGYVFPSPPLADDEILRRVVAASTLPLEESHAWVKRFLVGFKGPLERSVRE